MESLNTMQAFVQVIESESFSGAARELGVPKSTLSRRISRLEERLGAQLLVRTTRQLSLTDVGMSYYERCRRIVTEIEEAESEVRESSTTPRGRLRLTVPIHDGNPLFARLVTGFMHAYPQVEVDALTTNRFVHLVDENIDVAIRAGQLDDSSLIARRLSSACHMLVASPGYLRERGAPQSVAELAEHDCLLLEPRDDARRWQSASGEQVTVRGRLRSNDITMIKQAAIDDHGLTILPTPLIAAELERGQLTEVLPDEMRRAMGIYAVYPPGRQLSAKVRAFIDYAVEFFERVAAPGMGQCPARKRA